MKVLCQPIDDLATPAGQALTFQDVAADLPIQEDELSIHGRRCLDLGLLDPLLQLTKKLIVAIGKL